MESDKSYTLTKEEKAKVKATLAEQKVRLKPLLDLVKGWEFDVNKKAKCFEILVYPSGKEPSS